MSRHLDDQWNRMSSSQWRPKRPYQNSLCNSHSKNWKRLILLFAQTNFSAIGYFHFRSSWKIQKLILVRYSIISLGRLYMAKIYSISSSPRINTTKDGTRPQSMNATQYVTNHSQSEVCAILSRNTLHGLKCVKLKTKLAHSPFLASPYNIMDGSTITCGTLGIYHIL